MSQTSPSSAIEKEEFSLIDIWFLIRKRKILFLVSFALICFIVQFFLSRSALPFHIQQNFIAWNALTADDFHYFLTWQSEPLILNKIIEQVGDPKLDERLLSTRMLSVRFRQLPVFQTKEGEIIERYQVALFVRAADEQQGRTILSVWTRLCLEQVGKRNENTRHLLAVRENNLREMESFIVQIGDDLYPGLEQGSYKRSKVFELMRANKELKDRLQMISKKLNEKKDVSPCEWMYLKGQLDAYADFDYKLSFIQDRAELSQALPVRKKEIIELRKKIFDVEVAGGRVVILSKLDNRLQYLVLAPAIAFVMSLLMISCLEIASQRRYAQ